MTRSTCARLFFTIAVLSVLLSACLSAPRRLVQTTAVPPSQDWQEDFVLSDRKLNDAGEARYFILKPGFLTILTGQNAKLTITVLDETRVINGTTTRVVEEREETNGKLSEISRNFFAIDPANGDVFYYGEEVDMYNLGVLSSHSGSWTADGTNKPGLIMPGKPEIGMKYYQELAPGVAMDRAKVISTAETITTGAGELKDCLVTQETTRLNSREIEYKTYCPGIGLVQDEAMVLESYGYR